MNTGEKVWGGKEVKGSHREEGGKKKEKKKKKISNCTRAHKCVVSNAWVVSGRGVLWACVPTASALVISQAFKLNTFKTAKICQASFFFCFGFILLSSVFITDAEL